MTPTREQIERAEQYVSTYCSLTDNTAGEVSTRLHAAVLLHEVRRLRADNAALRKDKERLDWLEAHGEPETFEDAPHALVWSVIGAPGERDVRVVIDAARKET